MIKVSLARMNADRRQCSRRAATTETILAGHHAFDRHERRVLRELERRQEIRRGEDVRLRVMQVG